MIALQLSIEVAFIALLINMVFGLILNYVMKHHAIPGKSLIDSFFTLPLVLPPVVLGFVLLIIFSPGNAFGAWLEAHGIRVVFSKLGAIIASAVVSFPLFYQSVRTALAAIDSDMEDVARTLGASEFRVFWTISLPLAWKGILSGSILSFARGLGEFGATILIAGNIPGVTRTMPLAIYSLVEFGDYSGAFELVVYICILTLGLVWAIQGLTKGSLFSNR